MKPKKFLARTNLLVNGLVGTLTVYSMLFFNLTQCMNDHLASRQATRKTKPKHERLLQAIKENNLVKILRYIQANTPDQSILAEAPEGEATYIEHALANCNSPEQITLNTEEERMKWHTLIDRLVYYGFPLPKDEHVRAQLRKILTERKALVVLGTPEEVETSLQQAAHKQENMLVPINILLAFAAGQRRRSIVELLMRYGANRQTAVEHLKALKKLTIFKRDIREKYEELQVSIENYPSKTAVTLGDYITSELRASL